jgi:iron complex transport system substrate-binding protein
MALCAAALLAAACGSDDDSAEADGDGDGAAAASSPGDPDAFPVEVEHTHGTTTIEELPERVVTVGLTDQDAALALGVVPVGITDWFGDHPHAVWPWAQDLLGGAEPEVVSSDAGFNVEMVAALEPDVILALYSGLTDDEYDVLSQIAPTVAQPAEYVDYGIPWQEQTRTIGRVLGQADEADALVRDVEDRFAQARADHPEFEGATGVVATPYDGSISVYAPEDVRGRFMAELGFEPFDGLDDLAGDQFAATLSLEQVELLDVDALVWIVGDDIEDDMAELHAQPVYGALPLVGEAREVPVSNYGELGGATSFQTVLSLPVLIEGLVPMLAAAVDGDPETPVEQPG